MQAIDILCDEMEPAYLGFKPSFQLDQRIMRRIGVFHGNQFASPVVPLPHKMRVPGKGLGRGEILCSKSVPETVGSPEGRNAAIRRDAGTGQHRDCASPGQS